MVPRNVTRIARGISALLVFLFLVIAAVPAGAQPPSISPADRKVARALFTEGRKAFGTGDFRQAAQKFEAAYTKAPHHDALWNAARAWHRAGDLTRAANLYEKYLQEAPADAADRNSALTAQREIAPKVARIEVQSTDDIGSITVDGRPLEGKALYVLPGTHGVEGRLVRAPGEGDPVRVTQSVAGGESVSVALARPAPPPPAPPPVVIMAPAAQPSSPDADAQSKKGLSPVFFIVGTVLTAVAGGVTIWSGIDTLNRKHSYLRSPNPADLEDGHAAQKRTNILIGVTSGLGALTLGALLLTNFHRGTKEHASLSVGPGSVYASGEF